MRMWGFPTVKSRALGRVMATLKRLGLDRKPSARCKSLLSSDSLERTYESRKMKMAKNCRREEYIQEV